MKQYCRYCAWCSYGDVYYCGAREHIISEWAVRRENNCAFFEFNEIDVINPEHTYTPRMMRGVSADQLTISELGDYEVSEGANTSSGSTA